MRGKWERKESLSEAGGWVGRKTHYQTEAATSVATAIHTLGDTIGNIWKDGWAQNIVEFRGSRG